MSVKFFIHWNKRRAEVVVSDAEGIIYEEEITASDRDGFMKVVQDEIKYFTPMPVRCFTC